VTVASRRWRNLGIAAGGATAVLFAAFDLYQWAAAIAADRFHNDFTFYYAAARIGLGHGWGSIYDLNLQQAELNAMGSGITIAQLARFISPPPVAWAAAPLTLLQFPIAYGAWAGLLVVALGVTWRFASPTPETGRLRELFLAAAVGWLPVIYGLQLGQPALFVAVGVAGSYALLRANRPMWAGIALGALALKPQLAFLVPLALLAAGHRRAFAGSVIALGALGIASALALGSSGISAYLDRLNFAAGVSVNRELTLAYVLGDGARPVQIFVAAWTVLMVYRMRRRGIEWTYACALVGGMLATPYAHLDDLAMLGLAGWLVMRADTPAWTWVYVLAGVLVIEGEPVWGPLPVLAVEVGALVLVSAAALRPAREPAAEEARAGARSPHPTTLR
jgi:hypothetical protein